LPELEDALRAIPGVRAVSVVTGADARPTEVHVLANPGKPAKQVVRDVQSVAMAQHGLDIDHRIVSVVQIAFDSVEVGGAIPDLDTPRLTVLSSTADQQPSDRSTMRESQESQTADQTHPRPALNSITVSTSDGESHVSVDLMVDGRVFGGRASGPGAPAHRPRIVANATLDALTELLGMAATVESAQITEAGMREIALTVIAIHVPRFGDQTLCGSAIVRGDTEDAVARSVLAAVNRRLQG
jgi:hypothetical protein